MHRNGSCPSRTTLLLPLGQQIYYPLRRPTLVLGKQEGGEAIRLAHANAAVA